MTGLIIGLCIIAVIFWDRLNKIEERIKKLQESDSARPQDHPVANIKSNDDFKEDFKELNNKIKKVESSIESCKDLIADCNLRLQKISITSAPIANDKFVLKEVDVAPAVGAQSPHPPFESIDGAPRRIKQWLKIKPGLNQSDVKGLLGTPQNVVNDGNLNYWTYEDGDVHFDVEKKNVRQWEFKVNVGESDYLKWIAIKDNMSQLQVIAVAGNPGTVDIQNYGFGEEDDWVETWYYHAYEGDMQKSCHIRFSYLTKKWVAMDQGERSSKEIQKETDEMLAKYKKNE